MAGRVAKLAIVLEDDEGAWVHTASRAGGGLIKLEGVFQGGEEEFEIFVGKSSLRGEEGVHEAMGFVETVGNGEFTSHSAFFFDVFHICYRSASNGVLAGNYRVNGTRKRDLDGASYLTAIDFGGHYCTKSAHIEEILTHPLTCFVFLGARCFGGVTQIKSFVSFFVLVVMHRELFEIDFVACCLLDEVSDFAFEAHIGDEALAGFCIDTRKIASVRIAVGIGVLGVEEEEEVVAVIHNVCLVVVFEIGNGLGGSGFLEVGGFFLGEKFFALVVVAESKNTLRFEVEVVWKASGGNSIEDILHEAFAIDFCSSW